MIVFAYIGGRWHFVSFRPAGDLKELSHLGYAFHAGHKFGKRHNFLVDLDEPALDVCVVVIRNTFNGKYWTEFSRFVLLQRPEQRERLEL